MARFSHRLMNRNRPCRFPDKPPDRFFRHAATAKRPQDAVVVQSRADHAVEPQGKASGE